MTKIQASTQINNDSEFLNLDGSNTMSGSLNLGSNRIVNLGSPTNDSDVASKGYVDGVAEGLTVKNAVRVKSQSNYDLTNGSIGTDANPSPNNAQIDGAWVNQNDRVLLSSQTTGSENGIYTVPDLRSEFELDSGTSGNEMRIDLTSSNDIHVEVKLTNPGSSSSLTISTTTGSQTTPHQIDISYAHDGTNITSTVQDIVDVINNDGTASGWVTATVLQSSGVNVDNDTNGSYVNMGVWNIGSNANLNRAQDWDSDSNISEGAFTFIEEGTDANKGFVMTSENVTVGSDSVSFTQFSGAGQITAGDGLTKSGDTINAVATDNSINMNADDFNVNTAPSLSTDPGANTGVGLTPQTAGNIYVAQGTSSAVTSQTPGGDISMDSTASFTIQVAGTNSLITSTGSGIKIAQLASGNIIVGQGTSTDANAVSLSNEATLDSSGNFTLKWAREDLSGSTDGTTTIFSLSNNVVAGKEMVYLNGLLQRADGDQDPSTISQDYALDTTNNNVEFASAPDSSNDLIVHYIYTA